MYGITADVVEQYSSLFVHCWESYAVQQADGSYRRARETLSLQRIADHLLGRYTLGTYLLDQQETCRFAVFDADQPDGMSRLVMLAGQLAQEGIVTLLEASRRGAHLGVHFDDAYPARCVRQLLVPYALRYDVELYPKQEVLQDGGIGSLIRLPLGIHRQTGCWYPFLMVTPDGLLVPVGETVAECCLWAVSNVQRVHVPTEVMVPTMAGIGERDVASSSPSISTGLVARTPTSRGAIRAWCQSQDIFSVIGRYVQLDRHGVGHCPLPGHHYRGDQRPSFQVFGGHDPHWYCYTWGRAGDLFDFLCWYHGFSTQEAWSRMQDGLLY
jgi:hypothetical protein